MKWTYRLDALRRYRRFFVLPVLLALFFGFSAESVGQEKYPNHPITIVAPFPPGGVADLTARPVAAAMEKILKNPVVVVNKTGAAGAVGMSFVANSKADGYTLLMALSSISIIPEAGKLRPLAGWGAKRVAALPEVPTFKELGYDVEFYIWAGLFAPRGTPAPVMKTIRESVKQAVNTAEFKSAMEKIETPIAYLDAPEFQKFWDKDAKMLADPIKRVGKVEIPEAK